MYTITYNNKIGDVPLTMQGYLDKFVPEIFLTTKNEYEQAYHLPISSALSEQLAQADNRYYLNFSAYLVLDANQKVVDYAFTDFYDLMWILNLIHCNGIHFDVLDSVYQNGIAPHLSDYEGLIEVTHLQD